MIVKSPIVPQRVRKVPKSFSWIDHRLVRDGHIEHLSHAAAALYLFLVCVGDLQGLSYYGDKSLSEKLAMDSTLLEKTRSELIQYGLLAWKKPLYQVLDLEPVTIEQRASSGPISFGDILKKVAEGVHD